MSLAKGLSILFIFSKNQLFVLLIFATVFFVSISFISALIFMISFLLLILGFLCSSFSISFRCKVRLFIWDFSCFFSFILKFIYFIYLWLCWVLASVLGPSPVVASGGHSSSRCTGLSPSRPLPLWSTGSRCAGSAIVAHGPSHFTACGIFPDQGSNPRPLHWQADSQPLRHQGSPSCFFK